MLHSVPASNRNAPFQSSQSGGEPAGLFCQVGMPLEWGLHEYKRAFSGDVMSRKGTE